MATLTTKDLLTEHQGTQYTLTSGVKVMECKYKCGDMFVVSSRTKLAPHHMRCAIAAAIECQKQLHEHRGPYYDAWLNGMAAWFGRMRVKY